eukprot:m.168556 g.168556  ORF g.168556 m.168556 type:complete len:90 (-) comp10355_c0_seq6:387-656(-)
MIGVGATDQKQLNNFLEAFLTRYLKGRFAFRSLAINFSTCMKQKFHYAVLVSVPRSRFEIIPGCLRSSSIEGCDTIFVREVEIGAFGNQ